MEAIHAGFGLRLPGVSGRAKARQQVLHNNKCMVEEWSVIHCLRVFRFVRPRCGCVADSTCEVAALATVSSSYVDEKLTPQILHCTHRSHKASIKPQVCVTCRVRMSRRFAHPGLAPLSASAPVVTGDQPTEISTYICMFARCG